MFDFAPYVNLPLIWGGIIALAILLYVILDGFDLGVGILLPFAPTEVCKARMFNSIAPFWDGNETWLVLGGGGLFAAFPLAYSILLPAFYIPIFMMLFALILRGVAFEFRFKSTTRKTFWNHVFHFGSLSAAFCQGIILGAYIEGVTVDGRNFAGGPLDWTSAFSILTGIGVVVGYGLLGSTWIIMKTDGATREWARHVARYSSFMVLLFMALVSISVPFMSDHVKEVWFTMPNFFYLLPIPILTGALFLLLWRDLRKCKRDCRPFCASIGIFILGYLGLAVSMYPYLIPYQYTYVQAAASSPGLSFMLVGVALALPMILGYTAYCYYVFRGKVSHESLY